MTPEPVAGPASTASLVQLNECWAMLDRSQPPDQYAVFCKKPVAPEGIGLCDEHLAVFRGSIR